MSALLTPNSTISGFFCRSRHFTVSTPHCTEGAARGSCQAFWRLYASSRAGISVFKKMNIFRQYDETRNIDLNNAGEWTNEVIGTKAMVMSKIFIFNV